MTKPGHQAPPTPKPRFRSKFEADVAARMVAQGRAFAYEDVVLGYTRPATLHRYTPDFRLPNGVLVETKGRFDLADRQKHLLLKKQHPGLDVRFLFQRAGVRLTPRSRTTYGAWCDQHGFQWAEGTIPLSWFLWSDRINPCRRAGVARRGPRIPAARHLAGA